MDAFARPLQRYVDGEASAHEAGAVERACACDPVRHAELDRLEFVDALLARQLAAESGPCQRLHAAIIACLPIGRPPAYASVGIRDVVVMALMVSAIAFAFAFTRTCAELLPLATVAVASIPVGMLIMLCAGPLLRCESCLLGRRLDRRIDLGPADLLVHQAAGMAIVISGFWLAWLV